MSDIRTADDLGLAFGEWSKRPLADLSPEVLPFWEGLKEGEFRLCRCARCSAYYFPFTVCPRHDDTPDFAEMQWTPASGRGRVFASVVVRVVGDQAYAADLPYALALVEMEEGPLMGTRIVGCDPEAVKIGMPVEAVLVALPEAGHVLPLFRPRAES